MADTTAAEPLIAEVPREEYLRYADELDGEVDEEVDESKLVKPGRFIWGLTVCAGVSGLLFGYDTGVISSTLVSIDSDLSARPLTTLDKSLITSATSFFALLVSPLTGVLADALGRKTVILAADILFVLGALWQAWTSSVAGMIAGRSVVGAAVGSASFVVPLYIGELSPGPWRGRMVTVSSLFITGGQVVAYIIGWWFSTTVHGWRWIVGIGVLPAAVQFVMLFFMPETPRWLVRAGKKESARRVLVSVYEGSEGVDVKRLVNSVLKRVEREILEEEEVVVRGREVGPPKQGWSKRVESVQENFAQLVGVGGNRRALIIACMLQGVQQLCGFNSLMYFSATIFSLVGFRSPTLTSLTIALTNFLFTLVAFHAIDRIGRRRILLLSIPVMVLGLLLCAFAFSFLDMPVDSSSLNPTLKIWPLVIVAAMTLYVAGYAIGLGNVPWQQSELFPLSVRSLGSALATATNWGSNTLVGLTFLPMMQFLSPTGTFVVYAGVCVTAWVCVRRIYPETAGLGLEDVGEVLRVGWGVEESVRRARERRRRS
ncbi:general substrate transporter [Bimuria novae-zelandiae CBS 107.79]|uniref:General substrate transporter n=1 Tax=Bimuria novae-zelandiae CBS 107.79 TaxID=1447943 RepID=A0A6A5V631_9PLEO|nr:general substrate transporter [Bimuria novae-zelandiae CBS 107.79]